MALLQPLGDEEFSARIARLVQAWEENLVQAEPNRQRVFSDYQLLSDAGLLLTRRLRSAQHDDAALGELGILAERVSACLAFATVPQDRAAALTQKCDVSNHSVFRENPSPSHRGLARHPS
jgi:hypothetical protein